MFDVQETGAVKPIFLRICFWDSRSSKYLIHCFQCFLLQAFAMKPREIRANDEQDLFRSRLDQIIDLQHPLVKLAGTV